MTQDSTVVVPDEFIHSIRVRWSDCDPALIAFTGRIPYFSLEAIESWWEAQLANDWYEFNIDHDIGMPFVHMSVDFRAPVTPRHVLDCSVSLIRLGGSSVRFRVQGRQQGVVCFEGEFVEVFVAAKAHTKTAVPADIRTKLEALVQV